MSAADLPLPSPPANAPLALQGGDPSNTPPQTSQTGSEPREEKEKKDQKLDQKLERKTTGGEDWLEWTWGIKWSGRWDEVRSTLDKARAAAAARTSPDDPGDIIHIGGYPAVVAPGGSRLGKGGKGPYMPYRFKCEGLTFLMADRQEPHRNLPSLLVRADGRACLERGAYACWQKAQYLVLCLGGTIEWERLSRVDLCLDMPEQSIQPFALAHRRRHYVTRAKGRGEWEEPGRTLYVGKAPPQLRIYDKLAQVKGSGDGALLSLMVWHRWGGLDPSCATRVEFELTRQALRKRGIDSVQDYFARRADLANYLCIDWLRFTTEKPDKTHTTRAVTLLLWEAVRRGFLAWAGQPSGAPLTPLPREAYDVEQLFASVLGMVLTAAVRQGKTFVALEQVLHYASEHLRAQLKEVDWQTRMKRKAAEYSG